MPKSKTRQARPTVSIIGMGRVGEAMASALIAAEYPLVALVFHDAAQAGYRRFAYPEILRLHAEQLDQLPFSDLLIISTPDDAIAETAQRVAAVQTRRRARVVLHTSGALSSEVLLPLTRAGFFAGSMHPLVSIANSREGAAALRGASFCLEGHPRALSVARDLVRDFGGESFYIKTEHKVLYHAAAVIASPHLVALFDVALELLSASMSRENAGRLLLSLVESTVKNLQARPGFPGFADPSWALTGTFARGDAGTVKGHLEVLSAGKPKPAPEALEIYKLLGLRSLKIAKDRLDPKTIREITKLLKGSTLKPRK